MTYSKSYFLIISTLDLNWTMQHSLCCNEKKVLKTFEVFRQFFSRNLSTFSNYRTSVLYFSKKYSKYFKSDNGFAFYAYD